jgi:transposase
MSKSEMHFVPSGIEVNARTLVVDLQGHGPRQFANTPASHQALRFVKSTKLPIHACREATGLHGLYLALRLEGAGVPLMVANPRAVRHFAQALMQCSKTDRLNARVLRKYATRMPFQPWQRPTPQALKLMAALHPRCRCHQRAASAGGLGAAGTGRRRASVGCECRVGSAPPHICGGPYICLPWWRCATRNTSAASTCSWWRVEKASSKPWVR